MLGICAILALSNVGSEVAFTALISLPTVALNLSCLIPIFHLTVRMLNGEHPSVRTLQVGQVGLPVNFLAMAFALYCVVWMPFPPVKPVTSQTVNYAGPITIGVVLLAMLDCFTNGKKRFKVPTSKYSAEMAVFGKNNKNDRENRSDKA